MIRLFKNIRNKLTNLDVVQSRFDILQNRLDSIVVSLETLTAAVGSLVGVSSAQLPSNALDQKAVKEYADFCHDACRGEVVIPDGSIKSVADSLIEIYEDLRPTKKIAFLIHDPLMLVHYADVWRALGATKFTIVLTEFFESSPDGVEKKGAPDFFAHVRNEGYEIRRIAEIIGCGIKFEYVVTNHIISGSTRDAKPDTADVYFKKQLNRGLLLTGKDTAWEFGVELDTYLPLQIGLKQIRYMYGADISEGWSLSSWNEIYDVFLCHGVNDEREIKKRFKGKTFVMGYPRYDRFFSGDLDLGNIRAEFGITPSKKTLLWMPTLGGDYSSIPLFAEPLSRLSEKYNIIVRPHPMSFVQEKDFISLLEKFNFNIDRNALRDMNELFGVADVVLADNGGTPFSAIFLGKSVVFLDVPEDLGDESASTTYFANSSVMELKKHLPAVHHQDVGQLESMLDSDEFYMANTTIIEGLFKKYFDSPRGGGAKRVVEIFNSL
jgi:hypothetical protein